MTRKRLKLNEDKSEFLVISSKSQSSKLFKADSIKIGDCSISPKKQSKNPGYSRICSNLNIDAYQSVVRALVTLHNIANSLLLGAPETALNRLHLAQNNAVRFITRSRKFDHVSAYSCIK
ncbi:hypothetical protein SNE40_022294 [Patella caerulea]|uniref:Uncharacterized protein n=1 Tax=Patella caerulea TaxID=87958 RepID=A0AAN8FW43_PATCE